jgi:ribosomal protein L19E
MNQQEIRRLVEAGDLADYYKEEKFASRNKSKKHKGKDKKARRDKRNRKRGYTK